MGTAASRKAPRSRRRRCRWQPSPRATGHGRSQDHQDRHREEAPAYEGAAFGAVGAYEQLDGTAYGEIDPRDPLNAIIQDLELAPRNARGMVEYSMGISILKPADMSKANRTLLYETVNRGRKNLPFLNIGGDPAKAGDGFLQREGYTQAWSGWEGDITSGLKIALPVAVNPDGSPITRTGSRRIYPHAASTTVNVTARARL